MSLISCLLLVFFLAAFPGFAVEESPEPSTGEFENRLGVRGVWAGQILYVEPGAVAETIGSSQDDLVIGFNRERNLVEPVSGVG